MLHLRTNLKTMKNAKRKKGSFAKSKAQHEHLSESEKSIIRSFNKQLSNGSTTYRSKVTRANSAVIKRLLLENKVLAERCNSRGDYQLSIFDLIDIAQIALKK